MAEVHATLVLAQPKELADRYYPNGKLGGLAIDGRPPVALGARVTLLVRVKRREFTIIGQLAWVRHHTTRQPASFGIDFLPEDDAARVRMMAFARDEVTADSVRVEKRLHVELPVRLVHEGRERLEYLADLSAGGAFVRTWNPISVGELVELTVRAPAVFFTSSLVVQACVVWARVTGQHPGMGLEFICDSETQQGLEKLLLKLAHGTSPD
jgi:Tfp pilus assembly protein PilZ